MHLRQPGLEQGAHFRIGRQSVAHVEPDRLAQAKPLGDGKTFVFDDAGDITDEKIAWSEGLETFVDGSADMDPLSHQGLVGAVGVVVNPLEDGVGVAPAKLIDDVVFGFCDDIGVADRSTALRHNGAHP